MSNNQNTFYPCFACTNGITARCRVRVDDFVIDGGCGNYPTVLPLYNENAVIADSGCGYQAAVPAYGDVAIDDCGICGGNVNSGCGSSNTNTDCGCGNSNSGCGCGCGSNNNWNGNHWCCGCGSCGGCRLLRNNCNW